MDESAIQPSSVDLRVDRYFRVFRNHTLAHIDVKQNQADLTELVEIAEGDGFVLHPGEFVLGSTAERVQLATDLVARLEGKALSLETPIPTPIGWREMGDLEPGDEVFDEMGHPTTILAVTPPLLGRPCRDVVFSDGTIITADAQHLWLTSEKRSRKRNRPTWTLKTTDEIAMSLTVGNERNHQIPLARPVEYPPQALPINPYVFGVWLGDGTTTKAEITCVDHAILDEIRREGYSVESRHHRAPYVYLIGGAGQTRDPATGRFVGNESLWTALRLMGQFAGKYVPPDYLLAGVEQRLALLQGLMDSDGFVDNVGRCEFTSTNEGLADAVVELAASLGFRPSKNKGTATFNGVDHGPKYRVRFTPHSPVFRLPRKLARQKRNAARYHRFRSVAAVRETASVPVKCIQVASSGLFLASRSFIPTHNSSLGRLGLLIHSTAGFVDSGWDGHLTLELSNVANLPITIYPGMKIGQISFLQMTTPADNPYGSAAVGSKYQGQVGPTPSRYWENFESSSE